MVIRGIELIRKQPATSVTPDEVSTDTWLRYYHIGISEVNFGHSFVVTISDLLLLGVIFRRTPILHVAPSKGRHTYHLNNCTEIHIHRRIQEFLGGCSGINSSGCVLTS